MVRGARRPLRIYNGFGSADMDLRQKRDEVLRIAARYGARNLRVFGSVARGQDRADSDVDLLVDMDRRSEIPWKQIAGMRDRLTHDYFGVDLVLVWRVIERDLPMLKAAVIGLL